jgi:4-amino-4-deoxychorismate lyase
VRSSIELSRQKNLAGLKHLNRLEQVIAAQKIINTKYTDAIMCDGDGHIIETISKNIIFIKNNKIYSPKLTKSGVYGVALRWLQLQGHEINWKKIDYNDLPQYHGMMVCNSVQGFSSVKNIDNNIYFEKKIKIMEKIKSQWASIC